MGDTEKGTKTERTPLVTPTEVEKRHEKHRVHTLSEDALDTFKLGIPIFIAMLSWVGVRTRINPFFECRCAVHPSLIFSFSLFR
jgi:hypothetical protein